MKTGIGTNPLTPEQVTVTYDWLGRETLLIPDPIARRMECERLDGWQEAAGWGWGQSRRFPPGTWMHRTITTLMRVYAASPIPDAVAGRDREYAEQNRMFAQRWDDLRAAVVGEGDFDPDTRHWRDYPANQGLHVGVGGSVSRVHDGADYQITG